MALPIAGRKLDSHTGTATANGSTAILTPAAGKKIRVYFFEENNGGSSDITVYFTFAVSAVSFGKGLRAKNGGSLARSLVENYFEGAVNEALSINLSATGTVNWTIGVQEV